MFSYKGVKYTKKTLGELNSGRHILYYDTGKKLF